MKRPIAISLSPNTENNDVLAALRMIFSPWEFLKTNYVKKIEQWFRNYYNVSWAVSFSSGRGALFAILKSLGVKEDDEVILQAFTCVAVPNSIIATGAKPIFADVNKSLTIDTESLEKSITGKTKAIIIQHTFGIPADITQIVKIAKERKIVVIEDCAHTIGGEYRGKKLGTFFDASFFSFGRDKAFSSVFGGMAITRDEILGKKLQAFQKQQVSPSFFWVLEQLFHPVAFYFILSLYDFLNLGKVILVFLQAIRFLSFPVSSEERQGKLDRKIVKKIPNALSYLALCQLERLKKNNQRRQEISDIYLSKLNKSGFIFPYNKSLAFLRFPIFTQDRDNIVKFLKKRRIYIGKWYSEVIDPKGVNFDSIFYQKGSCPNAELAAKKIINLPTYPTMTDKDIGKIICLLKSYG